MRRPKNWSVKDLTFDDSELEVITKTYLFHRWIACKASQWVTFTPSQARRLARRLIQMADWCDKQKGDSHET